MARTEIILGGIFTERDEFGGMNGRAYRVVKIFCGENDPKARFLNIDGEGNRTSYRLVKRYL